MLQNGFKIKKLGNSSWAKRDNSYVKMYKIVFYGQPDIFYDLIVDGLGKFSLSGKNVVEEKFVPRKRLNGEDAADYVASMAGLNNSQRNGSHYTDKTISITLPDGTQTVGKIRVSNHEVDPGTFANNNDVDVCISIVVGKEDRLYQDVEFGAGREITVFEYVLDKKQENKERILMNIADKIVKMTIDGWNKNTDTGINTPPKKIVKIGTKKIDEQRLREIIKEEIENFARKNNLIFE